MRINHASFAPVYRGIRIFALCTFEKVERQGEGEKKEEESFFSRSSFSPFEHYHILFVLIFDKGIRDDIVAVRWERSGGVRF